MKLKFKSSKCYRKISTLRQKKKRKINRNADYSLDQANVQKTIKAKYNKAKANARQDGDDEDDKYASARRANRAMKNVDVVSKHKRTLQRRHKKERDKTDFEKRAQQKCKQRMSGNPQSEITSQCESKFALIKVQVL